MNYYLVCISRNLSRSKNRVLTLVIEIGQGLHSKSLRIVNDVRNDAVALSENKTTRYISFVLRGYKLNAAFTFVLVHAIFNPILLITEGGFFS